MSSSDDSFSTANTQRKQVFEAQREKKRARKVRKDRMKYVNAILKNTQKERLAIGFKKVVELFPEDLPVSYLIDCLPELQKRIARRGWKTNLHWNAPALPMKRI